LPPGGTQNKGIFSLIFFQDGVWGADESTVGQAINTENSAAYKADEKNPPPVRS
jgi:hypothetical protein